LIRPRREPFVITEYGIFPLAQPLQLLLLLKRLPIRVKGNYLAARLFRLSPPVALHFPLFFRSLSKFPRFLGL
jgi:hypothetical protein